MRKYTTPAAHRDAIAPVRQPLPPVGRAFCCYILGSDSAGWAGPYTGKTCDLRRRLHRHNHPSARSRAYTKGKGPWRVAAAVFGLRTNRQSVWLERALKQAPREASCVPGRTGRRPERCAGRRPRGQPTRPVVGRVVAAARPPRSRVSTRAAADAACQSPFRGAAAERCARDDHERGSGRGGLPPLPPHARLSREDREGWLGATQGGRWAHASRRSNLTVLGSAPHFC